MADQTGRNVGVYFMAQPTLGTPVSGAGATVFRINEGAGGMVVGKNYVRSNENRTDGQSTLGRHGSRSVSGGYPADATLGTFDALFEALVGGTWAAPLVITEATAGLTSITTTTSTIVASAGSFITAGLKKFDIIRLTNHSSAGNNSRNLRITDLTASTITVPELLTANAVADTSFTITRPKKLINPATRLKRYFTFEEREEDLDASVLFPDVVASSCKVTLRPDGTVLFEFGMVGRDWSVLEGAASPNFTGVTQTSTIALVAADASILLGSAPIVSLTGCEFTLDVGASTIAVAGSNVSPDVYTNNMRPIGGSVTAVRKDMSLLKNFTAEDLLSLQLVCVEPDTEPKDFMSFTLPLMTLTGNSRQLGSDGPMFQTVPFEAGKVLSSTNGDLAMVAIQSTAP